MSSSSPRHFTSPLTRLALLVAAFVGRRWLGLTPGTIGHAPKYLENERVMPVAVADGKARPAPVGARILLLAAPAIVAAALAGGWFVQGQRLAREAAAATGGDPDRAMPIMLANGCAGCHTIPGVPGAQALVGPRLDSMLVQRVYIGGFLQNTPANLIRWLRFSHELNPLTAMPSTRISEQDARDVAAYLYALR
jgi:cytochrome c1